MRTVRAKGMHAHAQSTSRVCTHEAALVRPGPVALAIAKRIIYKYVFIHKYIYDLIYMYKGFYIYICIYATPKSQYIYVHKCIFILYTPLNMRFDLYTYLKVYIV